MVAQQLSIEKTTTVRAPRSRVWRALTTTSEFATWFGVNLNDDEFTPGKLLHGTSQHPCEGSDGRFSLEIDRMEPERLFSWNWTPSALQPGDGTTHVEFRLEEVAEGTRVTVTESGFEAVALARRAKAIERNTHGWDVQLGNLATYASTQGN